MGFVPRILRIYRTHLAQFFLLRLLKAFFLAAYRFTYRVRSLMARQPFSGDYQFISACSCGDDVCSRRIVFERGEVVDIPPPAFYGYGSDLATAKNPAIKIDAPALEVAEFRSAVVVGRVDFVFVVGKAVHHDLFVPSQHRVPAENVGVVSINRAMKRMRLRLVGEPVRLVKAVSLIGQCSSNYAHWLTETLPKLPILDACEEYADFPLLVDDGLHPNLYASIDLINKNNREIIKVGSWQSVRVDRLVAVSSPGYERYVPHGIRSREAPGYVNCFSRTALRMLRDATDKALGSNRSLRDRRIYLSRSEQSGNIRRIGNLDDIEAVISARGIRMITPESMNFQDQVASCIDAEIIVAPVGASLANMIFAPPGCIVVVLSPYYDEANYFYYSNLAGILGHRIYYVLGPQVNNGQHPMHRSYSIDADTLSKTLESVIGSGGGA